MIDINDLSKEELIELRNRINYKIASLTLQEKKKENPDKYNRRTLALYFSQDKSEYIDSFLSKYSCYMKDDIYTTKLTTNLMYVGTYTVITLFVPKKVKEEILASYKYRRLYYSYTPRSKVLYRGYVIEEVK